jgi:3-oxoacid CoA-transferase A subunit
MRSKVADPKACIAQIQDGASIMMGGFGVCGIPENMVRLLVEHGAKDLTIISNNAGVADFGVGLLINKGQVRKMISTYVGENPNLERALIEGRIDVELVPQGTFAERIRAAGAGIAGFYTPTGVGTPVEQSKEKRIFHGREYLLEMPLSADFAFVKVGRGRAGQPRLPSHDAELSSHDGRRGPHDVRGGRGAGETRRPRPGPRAHAGHLRRPDLPGRGL